jgi:hypothetical protein
MKKDINDLKSKLGTDLPSELENMFGLFERFDPEEPLLQDRYYGKLKVEIISIPADKKTFLFELRKISDLSIGELMNQLKDLPFTILDEMCIIRAPIDIKNLPEDLAIKLTNLKEIYPDNLRILFKEKSVEDCTSFDKYPKFSQSILPETSDSIELK